MKNELPKWLVKLFNKKRLRYLIMGYLIIVFIFTPIYWVIFRFNTTSFSISEQLNKHVDRYSYIDTEIDLAAFHSEAKDAMPISIDEFCEYVKPDFDIISSINDSLKFNQQQLTNCELKMSQLRKVADKKIEDSIQVFKEKELFVYQQRIDSLKRYIEEGDSTEMILSGKYIELSHLQLDYANKNADICSYVVEKWGTFLTNDIAHKMDQLNKEYIRLIETIDVQEESRRDVTLKIQSLLLAFDKNRIDSVSIWDFLYYSICVSTTVSFGDIAPNNDLTRFFTIVELLLCVFLVGYIISSINAKD